MKWVLVLESDLNFFKDLQGFCSEIDPDIHCAHFETTEKLLQWFKILHKQDQNRVGFNTLPALGDTIELALFSAEQLGSRRVQLIKKMSEYLKSQNFISKDKAILPVILTSYEQDEGFNHQKYRSVFIENVLYKPFDKLISMPKIKFALNGIAALSDLELYKETPFQLVEMRKDLQILRVSELGFTTLSKREIRVGEVAIYDHLMGENFPLPPVYGICTLSRPSQHLKSMFLCHIEYLAPSLEFSNALKGYLYSGGEREQLPEIPNEDKIHEVVVLHPSDRISNEYKNYASGNFQNLSVLTFKTVDEFMAHYDADRSHKLVYDRLKLSCGQKFEFALEEESHFLIQSHPEVQGQYLSMDKSNIRNFKYEILSKISNEEKILFLQMLSEPVDRSQVFQVKVKGQLIPLRITRVMKLHDTNVHITSELVSFEEYIQCVGVVEAKLPLAIFVSDRLEKAFFEAYPQKGAPYQYKSVPLYCISKDSSFSHRIHEDITGYKGVLAEISQGRFACLYLSQHLPVLKLTEKDRVLVYISSQMIGAVGVNVAVSSFSEVHIEMEYNRPISAGRFRYFKLKELKSNETHLVLGRCLGGVSTPDAKVFKNTFALYSTSNRDLVFIRKWMHEQYRLAKQSEAA